MPPLSDRKGLLLALSAVAIGCRTLPLPVEERDQQLIVEVLLNNIEELPDTFVAADYAQFRAPTPDSARALFRATWVSWWHTMSVNRVPLPPLLRDRFARQFDLVAPPPDPYPSINMRYRVREFRIVSDSTATADIGPSFSGCTYAFVLRGRRWFLRDWAPGSCWIS